jgi:hypothetical protein
MQLRQFQMKPFLKYEASHYQKDQLGFLWNQMMGARLDLTMNFEMPACGCLHWMKLAVTALMPDRLD